MQTLSKVRRIGIIAEGEMLDKYDTELHLTTLSFLPLVSSCCVTGVNLLSA